MYRKMSGILLPVACLALVLSLYWGTTKQSQMGKMKIEAENQYQRSFHDFVYQVNQLDDLLEKSEAVDGKSMLFQRSNAIQLVRCSSEAQNAYHQLPVSLMPDTNADDFFSAIYQFAHQLATAEGTQRSWQPADQQKLQALHQAAATMATRMQKLQQIVLVSQLKWTDAESAFAHDGKVQVSNSLYDGFHQLNTALVATRSAISGPRVFAHPSTPLQGPVWTIAQIRERAKHMLGPDEIIRNIRIQTLSKNATIPRYTVHATTADGSKLIASYAQQGGRLLWLKRDRKIGKATLTVDEGIDAALEQLAGMGFRSLVPIAKDRYDGIVTLQLAVEKGEIVHYPHRIAVQVGLDRGDIIGVQVNDNYYASDKDISLKAELTIAAAKTHLANGFVVTQVSKVTLLDEKGDEVLAYAFAGNKNQHHYTVFLDANTGQELHVDKEM
jgi:spore germination protein